MDATELFDLIWKWTLLGPRRAVDVTLAGVGRIFQISAANPNMGPWERLPPSRTGKDQWYRRNSTRSEVIAAMKLSSLGIHSYTVYNLGTGEEVTLQELIKKIK